MARATFEPSDEDTGHQMQNFFDTLSEKSQRRFAAIEARQLGYGGIRYVAQMLGC